MYFTAWLESEFCSQKQYSLWFCYQVCGSVHCDSGTAGGMTTMNHSNRQPWQQLATTTSDSHEYKASGADVSNSPATHWLELWSERKVAKIWRAQEGKKGRFVPPRPLPNRLHLEEPSRQGRYKMISREERNEELQQKALGPTKGNGYSSASGPQPKAAGKRKWNA